MNDFEFEKNFARKQAIKSYAELYVAENTTAAAIPTGATFTKVSPAGLTLGNSKNCTPSVETANITIARDGKYSINATFSSKLGTTDVVWDTAIFINDVEAPNLHMRRRFSTSGYTFTVGLTGIANLAVGDVIDVRSKHNNAGSVNITLEYANINIVRIGD